jgi:hypothetical protein
LPTRRLLPGGLVVSREIGVPTSTLRAVTKCKVAAVGADRLDPDALAEISKGHRREEG